MHAEGGGDDDGWQVRGVAGATPHGGLRLVCRAAAQATTPMGRTVLNPKEYYTSNVPRTQLHNTVDGSN